MVSCVGGCLQRLLISKSAKHQGILPKQHHVSDLIIHHYHLRCGHSRFEHTLSMISEKFWIIQARISLRRKFNGCFIARKYKHPSDSTRWLICPRTWFPPQNLSLCMSEWIVFGPCSYAEEEAQLRDMVFRLLVSQFVQYTLKLLTA